jgi:hypothetical protein
MISPRDVPGRDHGVIVRLYEYWLVSGLAQIRDHADFVVQGRT